MSEETAQEAKEAPPKQEVSQEVPVSDTESDVSVKLMAENERMKKALSARQKEVDKVMTELQEYRSQVERERMSEAEKKEADLQAALQEASKFKAEIELREAENRLLKQTNHLVSKHGLMNTHVAESMMKQYDPEVDGDLDSFAERLKKDNAWAPLFHSEKRVAPPAPAMPGSAGPGSRPDSSGKVAPEDMEWAKSYAKKLRVPVETILENMGR
tara:strand:- start:1739 stop:2380 length:642 start_codon:yes stop_codon:yes gene_type:complete